MVASDLKYIYGPVFSWRLGMSLGIDPLSQAQKSCDLDCSYCQLGAQQSQKPIRSVFVETESILNELRTIDSAQSIDYVTFSGSGEPTMASNLGEMIQAIRHHFPPWKTAVITNATMMMDEQVQKDLALADFVLLKLDAATQKTFQLVNQPYPGLLLTDIVAGIKEFQKTYQGKIALQMMFIEDNKKEALGMAQLALNIHPSEVHLNTPLRPCSQKPLSTAEMKSIKDIFVQQGVAVLSVYEEEKKDYQPFDVTATRRRHGEYN